MAANILNGQLQMADEGVVLGVGQGLMAAHHKGPASCEVLYRASE